MYILIYYIYLRIKLDDVDNNNNDHNWQDVSVCKSDILSSVPKTYKTEGENRLLIAVF